MCMHDDDDGGDNDNDDGDDDEEPLCRLWQRARSQVGHHDRCLWSPPVHRSSALCGSHLNVNCGMENFLVTRSDSEELGTDIHDEICK